MPNLTQHNPSGIIKLINLGDPGSGKTGALASLAAAGYNLRILDYDNGLDILRHLLTHPKSTYPKTTIGQIDFIPLHDPMRKTANNRLVPAAPTIWIKTVNLLQEWKDGERNLGPLTTWTANDVLVIDSLTLCAKAAFNYILSMNNRLGQTPQQNDYFISQGLIESMVEKLYDPGIGCHVIVNAHIKFIGEIGAPHGYPMTLGKALSPHIGRYFNTILLSKSEGQGPATPRFIHTAPINQIELKNPAPFALQAKYPIATGLADIFKSIRGAVA